MKKILTWALLAMMLLTVGGCKQQAQNENITFVATITGFEDSDVLVSTSADVGFTDAVVHLDESCKPDFTLIAGQTVELTILPMMTKSIPPQVTAVAIKLIADAPENGVASVTEGLDPMPMLTAGPDALDAESPDTLQSHMADMHPILASITYAMGIEGEQSYLPADPVFVWSVLINMAENWSQTSEETSMEGETVFVPENVLASWALAAFGRTEALPALPDAEQLQDRVQYDETKRAYAFTAEAVEGDVATSIDAIKDNGDGTFETTLGYYTSTGERLGGVVFDLENAKAENGLYYYTVANARVDK